MRNTQRAMSASAAPLQRGSDDDVCDDSEGEGEVLSFAALPLALARKVFAALPVDARARACVVCRAWNAMLAERGLWTQLDLSPKSGVTRRVTPALLRAAAAKAGGALEALDVSGVAYLCRTVDALRAVLAANAGTLRELRCLHEGVSQTVPVLEALLRAAPQLRALEADVLCADGDATQRMLRNEGVFAPLRIRCLTPPTSCDEEHLVAAATHLPAHGWLTRLVLDRAPLHAAAALDALVDGVLASRTVRSLKFDTCGLSPASVPALVRLFSSTTLSTVRLYSGNFPRPLLNEPAAAALGSALRANSTLTALALSCHNLFEDEQAAVTILGAVTAHPTLRELDVSHNTISDAHQASLGAALGALVAANAPALTALDVSAFQQDGDGLDDAGLRPLFDALPANTHLRSLKCQGNRASIPFVLRVLLPAVRANTSLRKLKACQFLGREVGVLIEADELVAARNTAPS
jgi:hypothetical protein